MSSSLSSLADNLSDINCAKCDKHMLLECFACNAWFKKDSEKLVKKFANSYEFCNKAINKFILLLRKGVYPYEYMDNWKRFDETSLPDKEAFYSILNVEDITDIDYNHAKKVFKEFKLKGLGECHDLYVQSDTLLLADVLKILETCVLKYMN